MTPAEALAWLETAARRCDDGALASEAAAAAHRPEYEEVLAAAPDAERHARALELYEHVVGNEREAARLRAEAKALREIAELLAGPSMLRPVGVIIREDGL